MVGMGVVVGVEGGGICVFLETGADMTVPIILWGETAERLRRKKRLGHQVNAFLCCKA